VAFLVGLETDERIPSVSPKTTNPAVRAPPCQRLSLDHRLPSATPSGLVNVATGQSPSVEFVPQLAEPVWEIPLAAYPNLVPVFFQRDDGALEVELVDFVLVPVVGDQWLCLDEVVLR